MTWAPLLLADPSACLRLRVLRDMMYRADTDPEVSSLLELRESDTLAMSLLAQQQTDGSWKGDERTARGGALRATPRALSRLGYLGFSSEHPAVQRGAEYLFSRQRADGAWPLTLEREQGEESEGYSMAPLQTALPLRGLAACGYATDSRAERAYDWLLAQRLPDGAWPTGMAAGNYGRVAGYRRLAHSRWGCRSNTTGVLICLSLHPQRCSGAESRQALDLLLARETQEQHTLGFEIARLLGAEPARGFFTYYARFDLALILDLCWRIGATLEDARIAGIVTFVQNLRGDYGLWQYAAHPQISRWLTFDLVRSLTRLQREPAGDWFSLEPRTPFQAYSRKLKRY